MRLIDADALEQKFSTTRHYLTKDLVLDAVYEINKAPTIDPVKHGRWVKDKETGIPYCDWCKENAVFTSGHHYACGDYCLHCGARMDGEV